MPLYRGHAQHPHVMVPSGGRGVHRRSCTESPKPLHSRHHAKPAPDHGVGHDAVVPEPLPEAPPSIRQFDSGSMVQLPSPDPPAPVPIRQRAQSEFSLAHGPLRRAGGASRMRCPIASHTNLQTRHPVNRHEAHCRHTQVSNLHPTTQGRRPPAFRTWRPHTRSRP